MISAETKVRILGAVAARLGVAPRRIVGRERSRHVALARNTAMILLRDLTGAPYEDIARVFRCDHTTVLSAHDRAGRDPELRALVLELGPAIEAQPGLPTPGPAGVGQVPTVQDAARG